MLFRPELSVSTPTKNRGLTALSARTSAGNTEDRKQASYDLRRSIKAAKRQYKNKVEEHFNNNNPRSMWQGINNITGFKGNKPATVKIAASLPDELSTFYARFEAGTTAHTESAPMAAAEEVSPLSLSVADVTRRGVAPVGDVGVLTPTLFPMRGFNTHTFSAVFTQFCTNALQQSLLGFSGRSVSGSALAVAAYSPLPLKHDTGFECDRLMIGCSALSPASLGMLDLSVSSC